jgi:type VI secretion system protein VasJ
LSPYWFDGHALSAQMARQLGFIDVAEAIHQELVQFLHRLPQLQHYRFVDGTPFLAEASIHWLAQTPRNMGGPDAPMLEPGSPTELAELEEALRGSCALKQRVQLQLQLAAQLEQRQQLATASLCYHALQQQTQQIQLCDWEPELFATLTQACQRHPMS